VCRQSKKAHHRRAGDRPDQTGDTHAHVKKTAITSQPVCNGRLQKACRWALWAHGGQCSTSTIIDWCYARQLLIGGEKRRNDFNRAVRRALESIGAKRVGRAATVGRPWIWSAPPDDTPADDK